ncbi:MAG: hypothetical protein GY719_04570 [bacterium]|nr:hypothetical protein [bacterium]
MSYQGNPSLAQDVQERISNTFQQTLELITEERHQEALVGCEFILRMDPQFQPARTLVDRLKADTRPVVVDDLRSAPAVPSLDDLPALDDLEELDDLDDLGPLDDLGDVSFDDQATSAAVPTPAPPAAPAPAPPAAPAPAQQAAASGLGTVLQDLFAKRDFEQILQIATSQKQVLESDPVARQIVEQANSLLESETYVQTFLKSARQAREAGQVEEMQKHLEKARALDPEHPEVVGFASQESPPAPAAADQDLLALQQQSLSLDTDDDGTDMVSELAANDPRQTKPIAAIPPDDAPAAEATFESAGATFEGADATLESADASFEGADASFEDGPSFEDGTSFEGGTDLEADLDFGDTPETPEATLQNLDAELSFDDGAAEDDQEGGDRVGQLMAEGQDAFERGEYQGAIDIWSRIFLIDIDNAEASSKIEEARAKKAEIERQAEEFFHAATGHLEAGSVDEAKSSLAQVLELQPDHSLAREYLEQLESGQVPTLASTGDVEGLSDLELGETGDGTREGASPSLAAAVERDRVVVVKKTDMRIVAVGAAVLLGAIGLVAFLMIKWDDLFPNQELPQQMAQPPKVDPIERATKMHEGGNTENAILMLERIQAQDPIYEDAQALIAQWKALVEAPDPVEAGPSEEQRERFTMLVGAARDAHQQGRHIRARKYFARASKIMPLEEADRQLKLEGDDQLELLEDEIKLFDEGQYAAIIPELWRQRETDPNNRDIERLLVDSYYNLALSDLQRGNAQGAARKLKEALEVQPDNEELQRMRLFAQTYVQRPKDLLYRIFVKYLPSR